MNASAVFPSLAKTSISEDAVRIKASKIIEYSSVFSFRTRSEGFYIAPVVHTVTLVLNVVGIVQPWRVVGTILGWLSLRNWSSRGFQFVVPDFIRHFRGMGYNVPCSHGEYSLWAVLREPDLQAALSHEGDSASRNYPTHLLLFSLSPFLPVAWV